MHRTDPPICSRLKQRPAFVKRPDRVGFDRRGRALEDGKLRLLDGFDEERVIGARIE